MELRDILADNLSLLMKARYDLDTQVKLSRRTGVSQSTIQRVLSREVHTNLDVVAALARAFGVAPRALLEPTNASKAAPALPPSPDELALLRDWRKLANADKRRVMAFIHVSLLAPAGHLSQDVITLKAEHEIDQKTLAATRRASARPIGMTTLSLDENIPTPRKKRHRN